MKRIIGLLLAGLFMFAMVAFNGEKEADEVEAPEIEAIEEALEDPAAEVEQYFEEEADMSGLIEEDAGQTMGLE